MQHYLNTITQGDSREILKSFPDKSVDLIVTDLPYGMSFQSNHRQEKHDKIAGDDQFPMWIFYEFNRIARNAVYIFCRWDNLSDLPPRKAV